MSKKLVPYAIYALLFDLFVVFDSQTGGGGFLTILSIVLIVISISSDILNMLKKKTNIK